MIFKSSLYKGQTSYSPQMGLVFIDSMESPFQQKSLNILSSKISSHLILWGLSYGNPPCEIILLCSPPYILKSFIETTKSLVHFSGNSCNFQIHLFFCIAIKEKHSYMSCPAIITNNYCP